MQIVKSLPPISLSGNLIDLILSAAPNEVITVKLLKGAELIIEEKYQPDASGEISIRYKNIINRLLNLSVPAFANDVFIQENACVDFTVKLSSTSGQTDSLAFRVVKGMVDTDLLKTDTWLKTNFLTWQPQAKYIQYHDPEWLTYYAAEDCYLQVKAFCYPSKTWVIKTIASLQGGKLNSINLNYGLVLALFAADGIPAYYDVYVEQAAVRITYVQRFILSQEEFYFNDVFVFENSVGGLDTIRFTGEAKEKPEFVFDNAWFDEIRADYEVLPDYVIEKNTGFFRTNDEKIWSADFFGSLQKYKIDNGNLMRIFAMDPDLGSIKGELSDYTFNYSFSKKNDSMNLSRKLEAPEDLALPGDVIGSVVDLAPRINHYPWATTTDVIVPVQYPYESTWRKINLREVITSIVIGGAGNDGNDGGTGESGVGIFGSWSDLQNENPLITTEDLSLQFKTDFPKSSSQAITYLIGQFFIKPEFVGTSILLGYLPDGNRPTKKLIQYFITANIEMFLTVDPNGEVKISSKDGFNLPTGTAIQDYYFIKLFFKPGAAVQINYNGKWVIDPSESYCEPKTSISIWGKIFEENIEKRGSYTYASIILRTYKGSPTAPPADLSEPVACTNPSIPLGYYQSVDADPNFFNSFMNNEVSKILAAPNTSNGNPVYPKQLILIDGVLELWYAFNGQAKGSWRLLQTTSSSGNTGNQINAGLMWVSDDADERPLDINNDLCIVSGLPQKTMANPTDAPNYKTLNLGACPI